MGKLISVREILDLTGFSKMTLHRLRRAGAFPNSIKLSPNRIAFDLAEIETWILNRKKGK